MQLCGQDDLRDAWLDHISGRLARRVILARVLATESEVPLLDEPTAGLDPAAAHEFTALLRTTTRTEPGPLTRNRQRSGMLGWAVGISATLHVLIVVAALEWRSPGEQPPAALDQEATVEVVMGESAEANGSASAPPVQPQAPTPEPAQPTPDQPAPVEPDQAALPPKPAAPARSAAKPPEQQASQVTARLGDGMVGAAELLGDRLRPAEGNRGNIPPGYPHVSATLGEQGLVVLRMLIAADGAVRSVEILQTSGYPRLDQAAQDAITKWRFTPAVLNGEPTDSTQILPVRFRLD